MYVYPFIILSRNVANSTKSFKFYLNLTWLAIVLCILVGELLYDFIHLPFAWLVVGLATSVAIYFSPNKDETPTNHEVNSGNTNSASYITE